MPQRPVSLLLELSSMIRIFLSALAPGTERGSDFFAESHGKRRIRDEVGALIKEVTNNARVPNVKHVNERD
jgi:hypothetical protein